MWDPELHGGPWDPSKVEELDMMGEVQKGVWVSVGKKGVFDYEEYDDRSMKEQRIEHDSELQPIFGDEALDPSYLHPTFGGFQGGRGPDLSSSLHNGFSRLDKKGLNTCQYYPCGSFLQVYCKGTQNPILIITAPILAIFLKVSIMVLRST